MNERDLLDRLQRFQVETPSWGFGNSGTRFHVYPWPGAARTVYERIDDAALVHGLTGCCSTVALHIPWDAVDDYGSLRRYAEEQGLKIGAINPNLFGDDDYRLGSRCNPDPAVRARALEHCRQCIAIAEQLGSQTISLWLADGTNYPGQDDLRDRYSRLLAGLEEIYAALPDGIHLLVEYKDERKSFGARRCRRRRFEKRTVAIRCPDSQPPRVQVRVQACLLMLHSSSVPLQPDVG